MIEKIEEFIFTFISILILSVIVLGISMFISYSIDRQRNIEALAYNIYFEARNSTVEDQIATAIVVINRGIPYEEVYKPNQFSWTRDYAVPNTDTIEYKRAYGIAIMVYDNPSVWKHKDVCKHYTVAKEYPKGHWTKNFKSKTQIGKHYYYCN